MAEGGSLPSGGTSRKNREVYTQFCERLRVKFPGPTRRVMTERTGSCWALLTLRPLASLSASS